MVNQQNPLTIGVSTATQEELRAQFERSREMAAKQDANAPKKTVTDIIGDARQQINELVSLTVEITNSLGTVGSFAPFFDIEYLKQEGLTDIDKLDQTYMMTIGRQLISDYGTFKSRATTLANSVSTLKSTLDNLVITNNGENIDELNDIVITATEIQTEYVTWGEQYQRILLSAMTDITTHLNTLRAPEHQIKL